ncbi:MAG: Asp-tRNA(Asn)/Glu-tRNA(Gln) amidotransferase subunit GatB, partial [Bacilli bacterium]|nr:Asp-tRNA(Asn)/Glu-tRNA(Gln) amidotransferase subunit GatB [Bacilli bacterium]
MKYEVTIGLEVHCEVKTNTKMFSSAANRYESTANENINEVDLAFPGTMPVVNYEGVKKALKMAMALNCELPTKMYFDRKNYYYPDLPKGFQLTQMHDPVGINGYLDVYVDDVVKRIHIHDIHLEEDTASLDHYSTFSLIDYNRAGIPLLETVTEPCIHSADEALAFLESLRKIFLYCDVSEARTDRGQMRCDVNVSLAPVGSNELGTKVEMKNINSFSNVKEAIQYEIERQTQILDSGSKVIQETRRYDDTDMKTYRMREKVDGLDYKYYIEPNIPPFIITEELKKEVKDSIPKLQFERTQIYMNEYEISKYDAIVLVKDKEIADFFEETIILGANPKSVSNWLTTNVTGYLNKIDKNVSDISLTPKRLFELIELVDNGKISSKQSKDVFIKILEEDKEPKDIVDELGIKQIDDDAQIRAMVVEILEGNLHLIEDYRKGKNVFDFFVGQVMKRTRGQANPSLTAQIIKEE